MTHFAASDQFLNSYAIEPSQNYRGSSYQASGILRPTGSIKFSGTGIAGVPLWLVPNTKDSNVYVYSANGSVYTYNGSAVGDLNDGGTATGNGAAYYDNYIYFARDTTVARYGPLNGTPTFTDDYWVGTLGKTALSDTTYPDVGDLDYGECPNHYLHRHSDGKLYIADVVDNQGTIHYIKTTKTTVEGDTNDGSTYDKVNVGYGLWPTAIESYGDSLAIALYEAGTVSSIGAKIAFWDTTSENINQIIWTEFPDDLITSIKNINGVLYIISCKAYQSGFRVSRYIGGNSFELVAYFDNSNPPFPGGVANIAGRLMFGSYIQNFVFGGVVYSIGLSKQGFGDGIFAPYANTNESGIVTSICQNPNANFITATPLIGWSTGFSGGSNNGVDSSSNTITTNTGALWQSQIYKIGQPFKITKVRLNFPVAVSASSNLQAIIYCDDIHGGGTSYTLGTVTNTNYPSKKKVAFMPTNAVGEHEFMLQLKWTTTSTFPVSLPITIEYELIDD